MKKLWIGLGILVVLSPLGLIIPARFGAGSAWGEWSADELDGMVGYLPEGMSSVADLWHAPIPDYAMKGQESAPLHALGVSYILSAVIGAAIVVALTMLLGRILARRESEEES
ncbi:MAG: PDGLE domain-containing protein [Armatimonadetes bacterium]|nr:PDGLE domain-containing protein [Armatimonadota bacterium]